MAILKPEITGKHSEKLPKSAKIQPTGNQNNIKYRNTRYVGVRPLHLAGQGAVRTPAPSVTPLRTGTMPCLLQQHLISSDLNVVECSMTIALGTIQIVEIFFNTLHVCVRWRWLFSAVVLISFPEFRAYKPRYWHIRPSINHKKACNCDEHYTKNKFDASLRNHQINNPHNTMKQCVLDE